MKTKLTVRYISGRQDTFELDVSSGASAEARLKEFVANPTILVQTDKEVIVIPATAIENISMALPESANKGSVLPGVRKAKRLK